MGFAGVSIDVAHTRKEKGSIKREVFHGHFVILDETTRAEPKIQRYEVYSESGPIMRFINKHCVWSLFCCSVLYVLVFHLGGEERAGCFTFILDVL